MADNLHKVRASQWVKTTPETAFNTYNDYSRWCDWAGFPSVSLECVGQEHPSGVGAIRKFAVIPPVREQIVEYVPSRTMSYTLISGAPIHDHLGTVTFEPLDGGCQITWVAQYRPTIYGTGALLDPVVAWFFRRILRKFGQYVEQSTT